MDSGSSHKRQKTGSERDLDCSNASRGVWLVKVPKYISSLWEKSAPLSEAGRLKITRNGGKTDISFSLSDDMLKSADGKTTNNDIPKEHRFVISNISHQTLAVFVIDKLNTFAGKLALGGHVLQKGECRPMADNQYMALKRTSILKASQPERQVKQLQKAVQSYKPISDHKHNVLTAVFQRDCLLSFQPYLKEILKEICNYNAKNPHKSMWELKPEYRHYKDSGEGD
ncbi:general transcription factor IIF subunit 2 [Parasteatoda tepidariorum]|uniref:general transcription factor IIF subunit 2 n=1 Tax=Parasteatoda tepidariorum TaxID=114398 RepID=UPI0039BCB438